MLGGTTIRYLFIVNLPELSSFHVTFKSKKESTITKSKTGNTPVDDINPIDVTVV